MDNQAVIKNILAAIDAFCSAHGIEYCLVYGTLLGAIRHKDFIPWDDDLDVMMPRPAFDRFCDLWKQSMDGSPFELYLPIESPGYPYMIGRVSDSRYPILVKNEAPYGMGLFVDVYPFDGLGRSKIGALTRGAMGDIASSLCFQSSRTCFPEKMFDSPAKKMIGRFAYRASKLVGTQRIMRFIMRIPRCDYRKSVYVGCLVWLSGGRKDVFLREWFEHRIRVPFGEVMTWIPAGYDAMLKRAYGDYLKMPPMDERVGNHDYVVFDESLTVGDGECQTQ